MGGAGDPAVTKVDLGPVLMEVPFRKGRSVLSDTLDISGLRLGKHRAWEVPDPAGGVSDRASQRDTCLRPDGVRRWLLSAIFK